MTAPKETWTILEILRWTTDYFHTKGVSEPRASAEVLLAHTLGTSRLDLYLRYDQPLNSEELARFKALVVRRREGAPVAYLTGHREFWSLDFQVTPAVLIPRPETETLVAAAVEAAGGHKELGRGGQGREAPALIKNSPKPSPPTPYRQDVGAGLKPAPTMNEDTASNERRQEQRISSTENQQKTENRKQKTPLWGLEIGVGSGAVVVALAKELPQMHWIGVEISAAALSVARDNVGRHGVLDRVRLLRGNLLSAFKPIAWFDVLVANLPYVPRRMWETLARDIKDFEPREAFWGGEDGLDLIRPLIRQAHLYVKAGGWVLLEVGDGQAAKVEGLFEETGAYDRVESLKDFSGIERVVQAKRSDGRD